MRVSGSSLLTDLVLPRHDAAGDRTAYAGGGAEGVRGGRPVHAGVRLASAVRKQVPGGGSEDPGAGAAGDQAGGDGSEGAREESRGRGVPGAAPLRWTAGRVTNTDKMEGRRSCGSSVLSSPWPTNAVGCFYSLLLNIECSHFALIILMPELPHLCLSYRVQLSWETGYARGYHKCHERPGGTSQVKTVIHTLVFCAFTYL